MSNPIGIVTKVGILVLIAALLFTINSQAEIRTNEDKAIDLSRERMETLAEAMKFFNSRNERFTTSFDSLLYTVKNDTLLNQKKELVGLSNELINEFEGLKAITVVTDFIAFRKAQQEILSILDEVNDNYKSVPAIAEKNLTIVETLSSFRQSPKYPNLVRSMNALDTINQMSLEIGEFPLQVSADKSLEFIDIVNQTLPSAELSEMIAEWNSIEASLYELEAMLTDPAQKQQVFTNRYLKHTEIARRHVNSLTTVNVSTELDAINARQASISTLKDKFVADYFVLSQRKGIKSLEREELLLVAMDESTVIAPPSEREDQLRFKLELTNNGFDFKISCPNEDGEFSRGIFTQRFANYGNVTISEKSWEKK